MESDFLRLPPEPASSDPEGQQAYQAYASGYARTMRELEWAKNQGWQPTERQIVQALMQAMRVYDAVHSGKPIGGRHPAWLRGRVDALRSLLQKGDDSEPADS